MVANNLKNGTRLNCGVCDNLVVISDNHKWGKFCSFECNFISQHKNDSEVQIQTALHNEFVSARMKR